MCVGRTLHCETSAVNMAGVQPNESNVSVSVRQWICVWFEMQLGKSWRDIVADLSVAFGAEGLKNSQICHLMQQFREGRTQMADMPRSGRPRTVQTDANINNVRMAIETRRKDWSA